MLQVVSSFLGFTFLSIFILQTVMADAEKTHHFDSAIAAFTLDAYKYLGKISKGKNIFFSPYSISAAMSMVYLGARGRTAEQMVSGMSLENIQEDIHKEHEYLRTVLSGTDNFTLNIANRLYPSATADLVKSFFDLCSKHYHSDVEPLDFGQAESARKKINDWVSQQTSQKIMELIPAGAINQLTVIVLVNAIYFKGNWASKFKKLYTSKAPFFNLEGKEVNVDMMFQTEKFPHTYSSSLLCNVLELPYSGDRLSMVVILPDAMDGINDLEEKLTPVMLKELLQNLHSVKVDVTLPKFKLESEFELSQMFKSFGIIDLFSAGDADLTGIDESKMSYISNIFHKAYVDVNEEGTEAAAATAVVVRARRAVPTAQFRADHPFLFYIRDKRSGVILFAGRVVDFIHTQQQREEL